LKEDIIKKLKEIQISSFEDFYNVTNEFEELIENNDFTMEQWSELYDISERLLKEEEKYILKETV